MKQNTTQIVADMLALAPGFGGVIIIANILKN